MSYHGVGQLRALATSSAVRCALGRARAGCMHSASANRARTPVCLLCQMSAQIVRASESMRVCAGGERAQALQPQTRCRAYMQVRGRGLQASSCAAFVQVRLYRAHAHAQSLHAFHGVQA